MATLIDMQDLQVTVAVDVIGDGRTMDHLAGCEDLWTPSRLLAEREALADIVAVHSNYALEAGDLSLPKRGVKARAADWLSRLERRGMYLPV